MRFILSAGIAVLLLGSVGVCQFRLTRAIDMRLVRDVHADHAHEEPGPGPELFTVVLTPSFSAGADPFAVVGDGGAEPIRIRVGGENLLRWDQEVQAGSAIRWDNVDLGEDQREWFIEATPSPSAAAAPCAYPPCPS